MQQQAPGGRNPVHRDHNDGLWYFYDETWANRYGPYPDEATATGQLKAYTLWLNSQAAGMTPAPASEEDEGIAGLVRAYLEGRERKSKLSAKHKDEMKAVDDVMDELEGKLLAHLNDLGVDSLKAGGGVVYTQQEMQASIADKGALSDYIRTSGEVELLQSRVSSTVLKEWMNAHPGELPPGVAVRVERVIRVRSN